MKYFFCAVFEWKGNEYAVKFPDFPDLYTHGETLEDAFEMAQEVLEGYLVLLELQEKEIPSPTPVQELNARIKRSENVNLFVVKANTKVAKARNKQNYDRKSVTVEHYLSKNILKALRSLLRAFKLLCIVLHLLKLIFFSCLPCI